MSATRDQFEQGLRGRGLAGSAARLAARCLDAARSALPAPMRTLRFRIAMSCAVAVAAVMALASGLQLALIHEEIEQSVVRRQARDTEQHAVQLAERLRDRAALLRAFADEARHAGLPSGAAQARAFVRERPVLAASFDAVAILAADGRVVARVERDGAVVEPGDAAPPRRWTAGGSIAAEPGRAPGQPPRIAITVPFAGPTGTGNGALAGFIDIAGPRGWAGIATWRRAGDEQGGGFVVDGLGRMLAAPGGVPAQLEQAVAAVLRAADGHAAGARTIGEAVVSWAAVPGTDWRWVDVAPTGALFARLRDVRAESAWRVLAWSMVAGLVMFGLAARLLRRLERLRDRAARVLTEPDRALEGWPGGPDEIGDLSRVFRQVVMTRIGAEQRAQRARADAEAIVDGVDVGLVVVQHGRIASASPSATRLLGLPDHGLDGSPLSGLGLDLTGRRAILAALASPVRAGRFELDVSARRADGEPRVLRLVGSRAHPREPGDRVVLVVEDVTELRAAQASLELSRQILSRLHEGIVVTDADDRVVSANPAFLAMTGRAWPQVAGRRASEVGLPALPVEAWLAAGCESPVMVEAGVPIDCWTSVSDLHGARGELHVRVMADISELKANERAMHRLATHDPLTGLPNRVRLRGALAGAAQRARETARPFVLLYLDLDGFKAVNDTLGHEAGDALLCEVAKRLTATMRGGDTVFRLGGDEFVAIAEDVPDLLTVGVLCERVLATLQAPVTVAGRTVSVGASIGTCRFPTDEDTVDGLVRRADEAMLRAKRDGTRRWVPAGPTALR